MTNILYFGAYSHGNPRNAIVIKGLRQNGYAVTECRVRPGFLPWMYARLLFHFVRMWPKFSVMIVGFPGAEVMLLARWLTRKPIIFDAFSSSYLTNIIDRRSWKSGSFRARWYRLLDGWSCRLADAVLLDTNAQIDYFVREFGLSRNKFFRIFIGTDADVFHPLEGEKNRSSFRVHFHGTYIPLHGIEHIIDAVPELLAQSVELDIAGDGKSKPQILARAAVLGVADRIRFYGDTTHEELVRLMANVDVCLGIFGDSEKARLVIPNKIYEYAAVKKPVITLDTPAMRELFDERSMVLIPDAKPVTISNAVRRLASDPALRARLAERAYQIVLQNATPVHIGHQVAEIIRNL